MGISILRPQPAMLLSGSTPTDVVSTAGAAGSANQAARGDHTHKLIDTGWLTPTMENGWVDYDSTWAPVRYRKIGNIVFLRGLIKNGTLAQNMFVLPAGYRPLINLLFACESADVLCRMNVNSTGAVVNGAGGTTTWISLNNIVFVADA